MHAIIIIILYETNRRYRAVGKAICFILSSVVCCKGTNTSVVCQPRLDKETTILKICSKHRHGGITVITPKERNCMKERKRTQHVNNIKQYYISHIIIIHAHTYACKCSWEYR